MPGERTVIERTFYQPVERTTEPLLVTPAINIEVPAPAAPHITINMPERTKDERENVPEQSAPTHDTRREEGRTRDPERAEVPPVVEPPAENVPSPEQKPAVKPEVAQAQPVKPDTPPPTKAPVVKKEEKKANGKPGRKNTELQHAINWIAWEQTGFNKKRCPWKNPYECKKHQPPDENLIEARRLLGFDF